jgi:hypothetical protein
MVECMHPTLGGLTILRCAVACLLNCLFSVFVCWQLNFAILQEEGRKDERGYKVQSRKLCFRIFRKKNNFKLIPTTAPVLFARRQSGKEGKSLRVRVVAGFY